MNTHYIATIHIRIYDCKSDQEAIERAKEIEKDLTLRTGGAKLDTIERHKFGQLENEIIWEAKNEA